MQWLGGFRDLLAFSDYVEHVDARALDEVMAAIAGESDAHRITAAEQEMTRRASRGHHS